jgi:hypothetical protein
MPLYAELHDGRRLEFPDGTDPAVVQATVKKLLGQPADVPGNAAPTPTGPPLTRSDRFQRGLVDPINGGAQLLTKMLPEGVVRAGNEINNLLADKTGLVARLPEGGVDQQVREQEAAYQARRGPDAGFDGYRLGGNILNPANAALAARLPVAANALGRVGVGAAGGAASSLMAPVTEGTDYLVDKLKQAGTGAAFGGAAAPIVNGLARAINPVNLGNSALNLLRGEGVRPTIGQTLGGMANTAEQKLMSVPLLGDAIRSARTRAMEDFNRAAINRATGKVGQRVDEIGQEGVAKAQGALDDAYEAAKAGLKFVKFDSQFQGEYQQLQGLAKGLVPQMRNKFDQIAKDVLEGRTSTGGTMTAETFKRVDSELGQKAASYGKSLTASEQELGDALKQLQSLVRQQAARQDPKYAEALKAADAGYANLVRVEGAAKAAKNNDGIFTPAQLNTAVSQADRSTRGRAVAAGNALMQDLGNAGQQVLGARVPDSGTAGRIAMAGSIPAAIAAFAAAPTTTTLAVMSPLLYTKAGQAALTALVSRRPELAEPVANMLRKAAPALIPGAAQTGLEVVK